MENKIRYKKCILKSGKEDSLLRFHPWIFSGAIGSIEGSPEEGEVVEVYGSAGQFLAVGHYQIGSITVRILSFEPAEINADFWTLRIQRAWQLRLSLGLSGREGCNTFRLVHGEGDNLPGLVIDVYGRAAIVQAHSVGMHRERHSIAEALQTVLAGELDAIYYKSESTLPYKANLGAENEFLAGSSIEDVALENNLRFYVDWQKGQKTGFFVDQRDNRSLLERYAAGRNVLNMFCYTGGFSVYAMRGGANLVHSVDSSAKALHLAAKNIEMNFPDDTRHSTFADDAFRYLDKSDRIYDLIVLDPPAFAKHKDSLRNALQGYRKLNASAISKIREGGILFTFSCSQVVSRESFRLTIFSAAAQARRRVKIMHQLVQPADHPVNIYHPEREYLKGLVLYVE